MPSLARSPVSVALEALDSKPLYGFQEEKDHIKDLILRAYRRGESNSALILGPHGCGKSLLLETALSEAVEIAISESKNSIRKDDVCLVRLAGLLQVDDRNALKEITKQLKLENVVGERVFGSYSEHLDFLLTSLKSGTKTESKPILFVLDQFELFCDHRNQTLLYNLFDKAQSQGVPLVIIGVTARFDIVEIMEKRVKSRFCHRTVQMGKISSFESFLDFVRHFLVIKEKTWDKSVEKLIESSKSYLQNEIYFSRSCAGDLKKLLRCCLIKLKGEVDMGQIDGDAQLTRDHLEMTFKELNPDYNEEVLKGLSVLDLALAVATKKVSSMRDGEPFNFEMVYAEYSKFVARRCSQLKFERAVIMKSWETLIYLEIIRPLDRGDKIQNEYKDFAMDVTPEEVDRVVSGYQGLPVDVREWASSNFA